MPEFSPLGVYFLFSLLFLILLQSQLGRWKDHGNIADGPRHLEQQRVCIMSMNENGEKDSFLVSTS